MNTPAQLSARNIYRSFKIGSRKVDVLRGIDLDINKGESVFLCGASGAGKTTLLYTLAGLERPESGEVTFEDHKLYS
ncbi:MAG TPA: ATP-binding cassette domain-containing protein, partial [Chthoniobacterales bacterium]|nr:ATP-binding cassette domain-containing protein [Chthoniobacterales bacterium]